MRFTLTAPIIATIALSGCAAKPVEPIVRNVFVDRPVAVSCIPAALDAAPAYPDTNEALQRAADAAERYALIAAGRLLRDARLGELEPLVYLCRETTK